jgi:hypothetical protein
MIEGFDLVIGNPPYNSIGNTATGNILWNKFVDISLNKLLIKNGYLLFVHPSGWRKPSSENTKYGNLYKLMTYDNTMIYLEIHNINDGYKIFNCGTRYDWYLIQNKKSNNNTIIKDENENIIEINAKKYKFIPNYNILELNNLLSNDINNKCNVIYNGSAYDPRKKYINKIKNNEFKYEIVHSTLKSGARFVYSNRNDLGHFNIPKVIFGDSGINNIIIDKDGIYGMTQHAIGINDDIENLENIKKALESDKFKSILKSCLWSNFQIDWRLFTYFRKDFYKEFII